MDVIFVPFVTRQRFATLVGVTQDTLERWIRDGRVRTYRMGKRSLVDLRQWSADDGGGLAYQDKRKGRQDQAPEVEEP
jgi:excisionase family DNA binding protein